MTGADHPISDLRRAVKMMGIVAVNARVVAAGVVGDDHDFDVFTTDIAQLANSATRTIEAFSGDYRQLTSEVRRAATQRAQFDSAHRDTLSRLAARLEQNLGDIVRRRQRVLHHIGLDQRERRPSRAEFEDSHRAPLEHRAEKWVPVFRASDATTNS